MMQPKPKNEWYRFRAYLCLGGLFLGFALLAGQLYSIQVHDHDRYVTLARRQQLTSEVIPARRGTIYDRKFRKLALTREVESCFLSPREVQDPAGVASALARLLGVDASALRERIEREPGRQFLWVKRRLSDDEATQVEALGLRGVHLQAEYKRVYPVGGLASHIIGFTDIDGHGLEGLEARYEQLLAGKPGRRALYRDGRRRCRDTGTQSEEPAQNGYDLVLTIDVAVQGIVEEELDRIMNEWKPAGATIIVLDVPTGDVLALGNRPTFDANEPGRVPAECRFDRAVGFSFEPGSVFKPFVVSGALEAGTVDLEDELFCHQGFYQPRQGQGLHDHKAFGWLTVRNVVVQSSNIGMALIGESMGIPLLHQTVRSFGFGERTGIELPGEVPGKVFPQPSWRPVSLTRVPMGHEVAVTPIQVVTAMNTLGNDGVLVEPRVVRAVVDAEHGLAQQPSRPTGRRVIPSALAQTMVTDVLANVVREGTGQRARLTSYEVAGKTGTAQKLVDGSYSHNKFVSSFACLAPVQKPRISALVVVDAPTCGSSYYGGTVAAPSAARVVEETLFYLQVPPQPVRAAQGTQRASSQEMGW
jgi:cell division protein FtsI (penicillin-binding protein 3)